MAIPWLITLLIYGFIVGWGSIDTLFWLLLIPMFIQDVYDVRRK